MTVDPILAVIPARGGSKGLPGKNIRLFAGLPLIAHSIHFARLCPRISSCIISTDDQEIARIAAEHGSPVPFMRPAQLAQDQTAMMPVLQHALLTMEEQTGTTYGAVLLLDPTSPGRLPVHVEKAAAILKSDPSADGVVACSQPKFNPFWVGVVNKDGYLAPACKPPEHARRQDVPPFLRINGSLYLWQADFVRTAPEVWQQGRHRILEVEEEMAFSIDDLYEFKMAEFAITSGLVELPWLTELNNK